MTSDDADTSRLRGGATAALNRLTEPSEDEFTGDVDYLDRYMDGDDVVPDKIIKTGLNRILFSLDELGSSSGKKPVYVHLLTGVTEVLIAQVGDGSSSDE